MDEEPDFFEAITESYIAIWKPQFRLISKYVGKYKAMEVLQRMSETLDQCIQEARLMSEGSGPRKLYPLGLEDEE